MNRKILVIGMLDSIHLANWLERIALLDVQITLFPSRPFRLVHPKTLQIMETQKNITLHLILPSRKLSAYLEYALDKIPLKIFAKISRSSRLRTLLANQDFYRIHALEIQHAGYLLSDVITCRIDQPNIILTNWGSDIFYFSRFEEHKKRIRAALSIATYYSAECIRDYELARNFGFVGVELPVVPNSTTFTDDFFEKKQVASSERNQVIMKCYGGQFGYGETLLKVASSILDAYADIRVYAYSVTPELLELAESIRGAFPHRFRFATVKRPKTHEELLTEFANSRVYVGASRSDGISTSFLEALATGAFPIQTSTSCASEWVSKGVSASIVSPELLEIQGSLEKVIFDFGFLETARLQNLAIARTDLNFSKISEVSKSFYS